MGPALESQGKGWWGRSTGDAGNAGQRGQTDTSGAVLELQLKRKNRFQRKGSIQVGTLSLLLFTWRWGGTGRHATELRVHAWGCQGTREQQRLIQGPRARHAPYPLHHLSSPCLILLSITDSIVPLTGAEAARLRRARVRDSVAEAEEEAGVRQVLASY